MVVKCFFEVYLIENLNREYYIDNQKKTMCAL